jgi:preprotein translocase subunit SecD
MAVDANVLIFERIREELRKGLSARAAIKEGFGRATLTILDANVTTIIAAIILYQFGTGPIRGFAVTLTLGICASMFTAIFVSRIIFDLWLEKRKPGAKLSV